MSFFSRLFRKSRPTVLAGCVDYHFLCMRWLKDHPKDFESYNRVLLKYPELDGFRVMQKIFKKFHDIDVTLMSRTKDFEGDTVEISFDSDTTCIEFKLTYSEFIVR